VSGSQPPVQPPGECWPACRLRRSARHRHQSGQHRPCGDGRSRQGTLHSLFLLRPGVAPGPSRLGDRPEACKRYRLSARRSHCAGPCAPPSLSW